MHVYLVQNELVARLYLHRRVAFVFQMQRLVDPDCSFRPQHLSVVQTVQVSISNDWFVKDRDK